MATALASFLRPFALYAAISAIAFMACFLGGEAWAKQAVLGTPLDVGLTEALDAFERPVETSYFFAPFLGLGVWGAISHGRAKTRSILLVLALGLTVLAYFYVEGFYWSQMAMKQERWTAAALSVFFLPVAVGIPVVFGSLALFALAVRFDPKHEPGVPLE